MPEIMLIKFEEKIVKNTYINTSNDTCSNDTRHSQKKCPHEMPQAEITRRVLWTFVRIRVEIAGNKFAKP